MLGDTIKLASYGIILRMLNIWSSVIMACDDMGGGGRVLSTMNMKACELLDLASNISRKDSG